MNTEMPLTTIESDADFVIYSPEAGLISEHSVLVEASEAIFRHASELNSQMPVLPSVYARSTSTWIKVFLRDIFRVGQQA
jgi:hypothetical protein